MTYMGTRVIDDLGRIVIPKEIRKALELKENDFLDIYLDCDKIFLIHKTKTDELEDRIEKFKMNLLTQCALSNRDYDVSKVEEISRHFEEIRKIVCEEWSESDGCCRTGKDFEE